MMFYRLYIDPSVMSYGIQIAIGVAVTIGAIAGVAFRKIKKKVNKTLNIEDKKTVEEDVIEFTDNMNND